MARIGAPRLPDDTPRELRIVLERWFDEVSDELSRALTTPGGTSVATSTVRPLPGETVRVSPPAVGMGVVLPAPTPSNRGLLNAITVSVEKPDGAVRVFVTPDDQSTALAAPTVNGAEVASYTDEGVLTFVSNGVNRWQSTTQLPAESTSGAALDAGYVVDAAHASLPNARVATTGTEVSVDTGTSSIIKWAIVTASVALSKLADLAGRSVPGRAAASSGAMAAITASDDTFLGTSGSGVLGFRSVHNAALGSDVTWAAVLARGATTGGAGNHPTWASSDLARFDTAGTGSYPATGTLRASGALNFRATGSSDWRASGLTCTADSAAMNFTATLSSIGFTSATTMTMTAGTSMTQKAALGNNFFIQGGYLRMYTGSVSFTERFRIDPNGLWSIGTSFGTGTAGQYIRRTAGNNPPAWATISIADVSSDFDWAGVLAHDPASDGNSPEISNGDQLLFDTAGDGAYTGLSGQVLGNAGWRVHVDAFTDSNVQSFIEMGISDTGILITSEAAVTIDGAGGVFLDDGGVRHVAIDNGELTFTTGGSAGDDFNFDSSAGRFLVNVAGRVGLQASSVDLEQSVPLRFDIAGDADYTGLSGDLLANGAFGVHVDGSLSLQASSVDLEQSVPLRFDVAGDGDYTGLSGNLNANGDFNISVDGTLTLQPASGDIVYLSRGFLRFSEQSASTPSMSAGFGLIWIKDDAPNVPMFTDDTNVDHELQYGGRPALTGSHSTQQDDYARANNEIVLRLTPSSTFTLTGIAAGREGDQVFVRKEGASNQIDIADESTSSSSANRIRTIGATTVSLSTVADMAGFIYSSGRWRQFC